MPTTLPIELPFSPHGWELRRLSWNGDRGHPSFAKGSVVLHTEIDEHGFFHMVWIEPVS